MSIERPGWRTASKGVPEQIDLNQFKSVPDVLAVACRDFAADQPRAEGCAPELRLLGIRRLAQPAVRPPTCC